MGERFRWADAFSYHTPLTFATASPCSGCWTEDWQSGNFNHGVRSSTRCSPGTRVFNSLAFTLGATSLSFKRAPPNAARQTPARRLAHLRVCPCHSFPWQHCKHEEGECPCEGHAYDNQTNWDMTRRHFCDTLNDQAEKDHPFPAELKYTLDLTFDEGLDENGDDKVPYEPLDSGALDLGLVWTVSFPHVPHHTSCDILSSIPSEFCNPMLRPLFRPAIGRAPVRPGRGQGPLSEAQGSASVVLPGPAHLGRYNRAAAFEPQVHRGDPADLKGVRRGVCERRRLQRRVR